MRSALIRFYNRPTRRAKHKQRLLLSLLAADPSSLPMMDLAKLAQRPPSWTIHELHEMRRNGILQSVVRPPTRAEIEIGIAVRTTWHLTTEGRHVARASLGLPPLPLQPHRSEF